MVVRDLKNPIRMLSNNSTLEGRLAFQTAFTLLFFTPYQQDEENSPKYTKNENVRLFIFII